MTDNYYDYLNYLDFEPQFILEAGVGQLKQCRTSRFWDQGVKCHLFEPHPDQFREIQIAASYYSSIEVLPYALWDYEGQITLYAYDAASWIEGVVPPREDLLRRKSKVNKATTVPCCKLNTFDYGLYDVALIDVESSELKVLKHMVSRPRFIALELSHPTKPKHRHPDLAEIRQWLKNNGYKRVGAHKADRYFVKET